MDIELEKITYKLISEGRLRNCIELLENELRRRPVTPYHAVLGRDLLALTDAMANYLREFYSFCILKFDLKAIYVEMNGFATNPKLWWISPFGFETYGGIADLDWLCDWASPNFKMLVITGLEDLQRVFQEHYLDLNQTREIRDAGEIAEYLIVLRLQELVSAAHSQASQATEALRFIPVLSTAHDFDFMYDSILFQA